MKDALRRTIGIVFAGIFFGSGLALGGELQVALLLMSGAAFFSAVS